MLDQAKKDLADELQGIGISRLTVYPPGKTKGAVAYEKVAMPLEETCVEAPYHVDVV